MVMLKLVLLCGIQNILREAARWVSTKFKIFWEKPPFERLQKPKILGFLGIFGYYSSSAALY